jgi:hypothetical protein
MELVIFIGLRQMLMAPNNFYKTKRTNGVEVVLEVFEKISKMQTLTSGLLQNVTIKV